MHESDVQRLVGVFSSLAERGYLIVAAEHRSSLIAADDELIQL